MAEAQVQENYRHLRGGSLQRIPQQSSDPHSTMVKAAAAMAMKGNHKRYKDGGSVLPGQRLQHPSSMLQMSRDEAVINQAINSPKASGQKQRKLPQRNSSQIMTSNDMTPHQTISSQKYHQAPHVLGLGLGMGIQMGHDGRFYASMGSQDKKMPTAIELRDQRSTLVSPRHVNPQFDEVNNSNYQKASGMMKHSMQKLPSSSKINIKKTKIDQKKIKPLLGNPNRQPIDTKHQRQSSHNLQKNMDQYMESFTNAAEDNKKHNSLDRSNLQPFSSQAPYLNLQLPQDEPLVVNQSNGIAQKRRKSSYIHQIDLLAEGGSQTVSDVREATAVYQQHLHQGMNSTNESSFALLPATATAGQQLQLPVSSSRGIDTMNASTSSYLNGAGQQIMAVHPSQRATLEKLQQVVKGAGQTHQSTVSTSPFMNYIQETNMIPSLVGSIGAQQKDSRSFIQMKNKVEENKKQLNQQVAQQIIATVKKNRITGNSQIQNARAQKVSYVQMQQSHLPPISQTVLQKETAFEINERLRQELLENSTFQSNSMMEKKQQPVSQHQNQSQPNSQLCQQKNSIQVNAHEGQHYQGSPIKRHNSMEQLLQSSNNKPVTYHNDDLKVVQKPDVNQKRPHHLPHNSQSQPQQQLSLTYRMISEKRGSQAPLSGEQEENPLSKKRTLIITKPIEQQHTKRNNSIQVLGNNKDAMMRQFATQSVSQQANQYPANQPSSASPQTPNKIFKQEVTLEGFDPISDQNALWIRKAIEASQVKLVESQYLSRLQSEDVNRNTSAQKNSPKASGSPKQYLVLGQPQINMKALSGKTGQQHQRNSPFDLESPKKPDLTESNVKRGRLLLDKKKKQFEASFPTQQQDQLYALQNLQYERDQTTGVAALSQSPGLGAHGFAQQTDLQQLGKTGMALMCVPGITYKSMQPEQVNTVINGRQQQSNIRNLGDHPLSNQQLLNGYSKNTSQMKQMRGPNRKGNQDKNQLSGQGIQGKNITIMTQNKMLQNQANLMRKIKRNPMAPEDSPETKAMIVRALEATHESSQSSELRTLHQLQQQLLIGNLQISLTGSRKNLSMAMNAPDTGEIPMYTSAATDSSAQSNFEAKRTSGFFQFASPTRDAKDNQKMNDNQAIKNMIVFSHNGKTYVRNNDTSYPALKLDDEMLIDQIEATALGDNDQSQFQISTDPYKQQLHMTQQHEQQQPQSQAALMADQMVQLSIGSRSLSKMLQGAQLEAALSQLASKGHISAISPEELETSGCIQQVTLLPQQMSPRIMKMRARSDKLSKIKYNSPPTRQMKLGESNGSLSTKPATSATLNSSGRNDDKIFSGKKGAGRQPIQVKNAKQRVQIFHQAGDDGILRSHKINKAINTINNIIRLIFKNSKDSSAITCITNTNSSLSGPSGNRLIEDTRIIELQKIAKQINIQIPKKFDSKQSLREFFHSREFILNLKIKMQSLLHKAILNANKLPQHIIELNMCGKDTSSATTGKEDSKIYVAKKFYVGPGNNYPIIKSVLKQRYWWQYGSEESFGADCDFIWTSWKKQKHIDFLTNVDNRQKNKIKRSEQLQKEQQQQQQDGDNEQKMMDAKIQRKRRDKKNEPGEPTYSQAQIEKVVLPLRLYNKLEQNKQLTNKKGVFVNMRKYYESLGQDPFKVLPLTYHTQHGVNDAEFKKFQNYYNALETKIKNSQVQLKKAIKQYYADKKEGIAAKKIKAEEEYDDEVDTDDEEAIAQIKLKYRAPQNTWIVKPGENSNRGTGITVVKSLKEVQAIIGRPTKNTSDSTFIIQKYIDYPLLVHKRKFDFRCFGLCTSINGSMKGYCYQDGYIRTSCKEYSLDDVTDITVHLTNDAIQAKAEDYGKFENGNKMSFQDFSKVISAQQPDLDFDFHRDIFPQMQKLIADTYKATFHKIDPNRLQNCFELFGYDFMIDEDFRLYLIEVNTNPSFEVCSPLMARIIPEVLDNCFKIVLDPLFPSPDLSHNRKFQLNELPQEVKFLLVFDEDVEGEQIRANFARGVQGSIQEAVGEEDIESDKEQELAEDDGDDAY